MINEMSPVIFGIKALMNPLYKLYFSSMAGMLDLEKEILVLFIVEIIIISLGITACRLAGLSTILIAIASLFRRLTFLPGFALM